MSEFWRIYRLVVERRALVIGLMLAAVAAVFVAQRVAQNSRQYTATAMVLPSQRAMAAGGLYKDSGNNVLSPTYDRDSRLALFTQSILNQQDEALSLASESPRAQKLVVAQALANQLQHLDPRDRKTIFLADGITIKPNISDDNLDKVLRSFRVPLDPKIWAVRSVTPAIQKEVRDGLSASPRVDSSIIANPGSSTPAGTMTDYLQVQAQTTNPEFSQQFATLVAACFVNYYYDAGREEYSSAKAQYRASQQDAKSALDQAQNALVDFQRTTGLVNLPAQSTAQVGALQALKQQRDAAQVQFSAASESAASLKAQLTAAPKENTTQLDPQSRPEVQALQSKVTSEEADLEALGARYTPANPAYMNAQAQLNADHRALAKILKQPYVAAQANPEYAQLTADQHAAETQAASAQATLKTLSSQIDSLQSANSKTLPEAEKKLNVLKNALETAERNKKAADDAYASLVQTGKSVDNGQIRLVDPATFVLAGTSGPGLAALLLYAVLLSLVIGIGLVVGIDALDNRVQTIDDAEKLLGMSISAAIPAMPPGDQKRLIRMVVSDPLSPVAEAYRLLRTDLLFTAEDKPFKSLMGATAKPGQGATTTICNLAVALAQVGKRVILIDADLRRPKLHDFFDVSNETGLTSLLRRECEMEEALKLTDIDNLLVLPAGPLSLNPSELLASPAMRSLHERLKPHTDFILIDTPSAIAFSDASILASFTDAVLLVIRAQEAPRGGEGRVRDLLTKARANVVGVVLNGVRPQLVDSYHYHADYYPRFAGDGLPSPAALPALESACGDGPGELIVHETQSRGRNGNGHENGNGCAQVNGYEPTLMGIVFNHAHADNASQPVHNAPEPICEAPAPSIEEIPPPLTSSRRRRHGR